MMLALFLFISIFDIPPIQIADRYTVFDRSQVREILSFNLALQNKIRQHQWFYPEQYREELAELKRLHHIWDAVDDCLSGMAEHRMRGLINLQKAIGKDAMYRMQLPYPMGDVYEIQ